MQRTATPPPFRTLMRTHARELLRDRRTLGTTGIAFLALIAILGGIDLLIASGAGRAPGLLRSSLGLVSLIGFLAIALVHTTAQLVSYRERGVLRLLATTPVSTRRFLASHVPIRAVALAAEALTILVLACGFGLGTRALLALAVTLASGAAMLLSLGYLLAARLADAGIARQLSYLIPLLALATSGALFPLAILPYPMRFVCAALPTTWFITAVEAHVNGSSPQVHIGALWCAMATLTALASLAAASTFVWTKPG